MSSYETVLTIRVKSIIFIVVVYRLFHDLDFQSETRSEILSLPLSSEKLEGCPFSTSYIENKFYCAYTECKINKNTPRSQLE